MAYTVGSSTPICSFNPSSKPTSVPHKAFRIIEAFQSTNPIRLLPCAAKASDGADSNQTRKNKSILCSDCNGNGDIWFFCLNSQLLLKLLQCSLDYDSNIDP
ncbi:uncharacterized protein LOC111785312 [Cucurbita pepo subsp. pepo]|uniref:uncharacterized protein LOC111785312 n=1 Tax=Cucurbita pepo subsp. pepo TaxID=3664 RepID=UPI000C9D65E6|nr:uncharacterized protein LOC111785312 [Cucurbita pepo subsp. pepo]